MLHTEMPCQLYPPKKIYISKKVSTLIISEQKKENEYHLSRQAAHQKMYIFYERRKLRNAHEGGVNNHAWTQR